MLKKIHLYTFLLSLLVMVFTSACQVGKYMPADKSLLKKTKVVFKNKKDVIEVGKLSDELSSFITQSINSKIFLVFPKEYLYLKNSGENKNTLVHKALRSLGEPPEYYDVEESRTIAKNMENYLKYKKGYYHAKVDFMTQENLRVSTTSEGSYHWTNTQVTYIVSTGERYKVKNIRYVTEDKNLLTFIESIRDKAFVHAEDYIDFRTFEMEKTRLTLAIQNEGYTSFASNFIEIEGDSSQTEKNIDIDFIIKKPLPDTLHKKYSIGNIRVYTDFVRNQSPDSLKSMDLDGVTFYRQSQKFLVKPSLLNNSIFLKKDEVLNRENRQKSYKKLNSLGTYRFVTIQSLPDEHFDTVMNFNVLLTPYPKKWIFDGGLQSYYSTLGDFDLLGLSASAQAIHRNLFGGSERFTIRLEAGSELGFPLVSDGDGIPRRTVIQRTSTVSLQNNLTIPSYVDFVGLGFLAHRTGIIKDRFFRNFSEQASTNIGLGFSVNDIRDFFSIQSGNATFGFDYTSQKGNRYIFKPLGLNVDLYDIKNMERFSNNPLILLSFQDILGTGFIFRDLTYIYNRPKNDKGHSFLLFNALEFSGVEVHLTNQLVNAITGNDRVWSISTPTELAFSKYIRYQFDGRYGYEINKISSLASRINAGIIVPFGENRVNPFVKQFGVGGPNSLRAWNINQPGPGGYFDRSSLDTVGIFVNQGDIRLEVNAEYRFKIVWKLEGAVFVDAGNIWMLRKDNFRPGAAISRDFLNQIAIGSGYGLRFNFDFFIIRFDFGYKIRSPFVNESRPRHWYTLREIGQQGIGNVQVAVNYPF